MTAKRKAAYLAKHPETAHGAVGCAGRKDDKLSSFADDAASKTGMDKRTVQRNAERGEKVTPGALAMHRECEHCGGPIPDRRRADAMYCSVACNKASYAAVLAQGLLDDKANRPPCKGCGAAIPAKAPAHREFCCVPCQRQARYRAKIEARPVQTCPACGSGFRPVRHDGGQRYCSHQCSQESYRTGHPINCHQCGTKIQTPRQQQKFCDTLCQGRWHWAKRRARRG